MSHLPIVAVIFLAVFTQSLSGFGSALIAMAILPGLMGIQTATPLVALVALTIELFLLLQYRESMNLRAVWKLAGASIIGIPLGIWALRQVDEKIVMMVLGAVIAGYAAYALLEIRLPELGHPLWAYGVGFIAGLLGGAYNTSGPPVVIYGSCRRWLPNEFKSNLQGFFFLNSIFVVASHAWSRNLTPLVWDQYLWSLPAIGLGILGGVSLDRLLNPAAFRKIVLVLLVLMGLRLVLWG